MKIYLPDYSKVGIRGGVRYAMFVVENTGKFGTCCTELFSLKEFE